MNLRYKSALVAALVIVLPSVVLAQAKKDPEIEALERMLGGGPMLDPPELARVIERASASPLGSAANPVRAEQPKGQRAYLSRLRCSDGRPPKFERGRSVGLGIYMSIVDVYIVDCGAVAPGRVNVQIDMYFRGHVEKQPVPGFTILPN